MSEEGTLTPEVRIGQLEEALGHGNRPFEETLRSL